MRVILRENIENLGRKGDIVNVASGYGRNYLIPKKIAIEVTSRNMKMIEIEQKALQKGFEKELASYQELTDRLNAVTLSFKRKTSEKDVIFGSVSSTDIRDALAAQGFEVEKKKILLDEPIKMLGNYTVLIKTFHEERAEVKLEVVKEGEPGVKVEKELGPDLVEEGAAATEPVEEKKEFPVVEEKKEEVAAPVEEEAQDASVEVKEEPKPGPAVIPEKASSISEESEGIPEEVTEIPEEIKESPEDAGVVSKEAKEPESIVEAQVTKNQKETTEESSLDETKEAPLGTQEAESGESPEGTGVIPEEAGAISEESEESPEDAGVVSKEPAGKAEKDDSQEAESKDNK
ncbi:MAG: 50S ribosomal protein L9 [Candidatus Aminicenantaceae bacterium]